jgi:hypothetical protein
MPRQRDYAREYANRAARAKAQGTTYGRIKYQQDKARSEARGYSLSSRSKASRQFRRIADNLGLEPKQLPTKEIRDQMINDIFNDEDMEHDSAFWDAFRAWYGRVSAA